MASMRGWYSTSILWACTLSSLASSLYLQLQASAHGDVHNSPSISNQMIFGDPSISTCPTSNCPAPPALPVLATQIVHGQTTKGANQQEWLSTLGLYVGTGARGPNDSTSSQKVTQYLGAMQGIGAGAAWALNTDSVRNAIPGGDNSFGGFEGSGIAGKPGAISDDSSTVGYELDFTNWDKDAGPGRGPFTAGMYVHAQGSYTSLAGIYFDAAMVPGKPAWDSGLLFNGADVIRESVITDWTNATTGYSVGGSHKIGINLSGANADMTAVSMREGQTICFNTAKSCLFSSEGKLSYKNDQGKTVFTLDGNGNIWIAGSIMHK